MPIMVSTPCKIMSGIALVLIVLGVVSIIMGFSYQWPDAHPPGAIFFVGGWLLGGITWIGSILEKISAALAEKQEP